MCPPASSAGSEIMSTPAPAKARSADVLAELDVRHAAMVAGLLQVAVNAVEERRLIQELRKELAGWRGETAAPAAR